MKNERIPESVQEFIKFHTKHYGGARLLLDADSYKLLLDPDIRKLLKQGNP